MVDTHQRGVHRDNFRALEKGKGVYREQFDGECIYRAQHEYARQLQAPQGWRKPSPL